MTTVGFYLTTHKWTFDTIYWYQYLKAFRHCIFLYIYMRAHACVCVWNRLSDKNRTKSHRSSPLNSVLIIRFWWLYIYLVVICAADPKNPFVLPILLVKNIKITKPHTMTAIGRWTTVNLIIRILFVSRKQREWNTEFISL